MVAQPVRRNETLLSYITTGMAVHDMSNEKVGRVTRVQLSSPTPFLEVEAERGPQHYYVRAEQISSVGFFRLWLRVSGAELLRV